ncbi:MAG TPA: hypothetical protein DCG72_02115 [Gammaproteobacteria bacterium]|nr:hypothetical protein [Gammaproteobacteria bacterium]
MPFQAPNRRADLRNALIDTRPVDAGMQNLGNALAERRQRMLNEQIGQAAAGGNLEQARDAAYKGGNLEAGMHFGNALAQRRNQQQRLDLQRHKLAQGPKLTAAQQNFEYAQRNPAFAKYQQSLKRSQNITVNAGEKSYDKELGKQNAKMFIDSQKAGSKAQTTLNNLRVLEKAAADPNIYTGAGGNVVQGLKKAAQSFGVKVKGVGSAELVESLSKEIAVNNKDKLPGPMSNSDRQFLVDMAPSLTKTPEGNRLIIGLGVLSQQYQIARSKAVREYAAANGGRLDAGVYQVLGQVDADFGGQFSGLMSQLKSVPEAEPRSPLAGIPKLTAGDRSTYDQLPSGAQFIDPEGVQRVKP